MRGQALVLLALLMLIISLGVLLTLCLGVRVRERTELQTVADAAAYSQAVVTARTLNAIAAMNRTQLAVTVSALSVQSLISWSSYYRGALTVLRALARDLREPGDPCAHSDRARCRCQRSEQELDRLDEVIALEERRIAWGWPGADFAASEQLRTLMVSAEAWHEQGWMLTDLAESVDGLNGRVPLAGAIARAAGVEALGPLEVNARERDALLDPEPRGWPNHQQTGDAVRAALGTRGDAFVTRRDRATDRIVARLDRLLGLGYRVSLDETGTSYYGPLHLDHGADPAASAIWGEDHGHLSLRLMLRPRGCLQAATREVFAQVKSTQQAENDEEHRWGDPRGDGASDPNPVLAHHLGNCTACPGVWPRFINLDAAALDRETDLWGQPKTLALLRRAEVRREPFALRVGLWGGRLDLAAQPVQLAAAAGLVYYHRGGPTEGVRHFREPPNLFNPFWRATLSTSDVDEAQPHAGDDLLAALDQHEGVEAAQTLRLLRAQGYRGLQ